MNHLLPSLPCLPFWYGLENAHAFFFFSSFFFITPLQLIVNSGTIRVNEIFKICDDLLEDLTFSLKGPDTMALCLPFYSDSWDKYVFCSLKWTCYERKVKEIIDSNFELELIQAFAFFKNFFSGRVDITLVSLSHCWLCFPFLIAKLCPSWHNVLNFAFFVFFFFKYIDYAITAAHFFPSLFCSALHPPPTSTLFLNKTNTHTHTKDKICTFKMIFQLDQRVTICSWQVILWHPCITVESLRCPLKHFHFNFCFKTNIYDLYMYTAYI